MNSTDPSQLPEPFRIDLEPHRATIVVAPHGEVDVGSAGQLGDQLREVLEAGFKRIVLDLRGVSFIDSSGLRAILDAEAASRSASLDLVLVPGPAAVQRLFELTRTETVLHFIDIEEIDRDGRQQGRG